MKKLTLNGVEAATELSHLQMKAIKGGTAHTFNCYCTNKEGTQKLGRQWQVTVEDVLEITAEITKNCTSGAGTCTKAS